MTTQTDWIGAEPPEERSRRQMRDTRDSVADQKARLSLKLHKLCQYVPQMIRSGDVYKTREWVMRQASANELQMAVASLEGYLNTEEAERFGR